MRIGLISDTHGSLDEKLLEYFADADEVWHAGDVGSIDVLTRLEQFRPGRVRAVYGNIDGPEVRAAAPYDLAWDCDGLSIYMTHIGGYPGNYDRRAKREILRRRPGLFLCGHSHILKVMRDLELGLIHMNPGSCGHNGFHAVRTALRFSVDRGKVSALEAIELGPRSRLAVRG